jgi:hypothetical protein
MRTAALLALLLSASSVQAQNPPQSGFYFDTQFLWFDSPLQDEYFNSGHFDTGGLVELAPRFILGYDDAVGARVRWWTFDRSVGLTNSNALVADTRLAFNVVDLEATTHVRSAGTDFLLSGGARIADIEFDQYLAAFDWANYERTTMGGLTLAAEGRTGLFANELWGMSFVYGGRLSLLKGDWQGDYEVTPGFDIPLNTQNETFIATEVFTGVEAHYGRAFTRLSVEMQDWRGDAEPIGHNFGLTGLGFDVGYSF